MPRLNWSELELKEEPKLDWESLKAPEVPQLDWSSLEGPPTFGERIKETLLPVAKDIIYGFKRFGQTTYSGMMDASRSFYSMLDSYATKLSNLTGWSKGGAFRTLAELSKAPKEWEPENIIEHIYKGIGGATVVVPQYMIGVQTLGPFGMAGVGAAYGGAQEGLKGAAKGALKGAMFQQILAGASAIPRFAAIPTVAGIGAGMAALEGGDINDIITGGAILGILSAAGRYPSTKQFLAPYKEARWRVRINAFRTARNTFVNDLIRRGAPKPQAERFADIYFQFEINKAGGFGKVSTKELKGIASFIKKNPNYKLDPDFLNLFKRPRPKARPEKPPAPPERAIAPIRPPAEVVTKPPIAPPTEVPKPPVTPAVVPPKPEALAEIRTIMPRIKELSAHITASKSIGEEVEPEVYEELERLESRVSELRPIAYPKAEVAPPEPEVITKAPISPKAKPMKLQDTIKTAQRVIDKKAYLPILSNVLVKDGNLIATDLETALVVKTDKPDGLYKFIGMNLEKSDLPKEDFPVVPYPPTEIGKISSREEFITNLQRALRFVSKDETRYTLMGVLLKAEGGKGTIVSTDGRRLSASDIELKNFQDGEYIISNPKKVLNALGGISGEELTVKINKDKTNISFEGDNGLVINRLIEGKFPDYTAPFRTSKFNQQYIADKNRLSSALKTLQPYAKEENRFSPFVDIKRVGENLVLTAGKEGALKLVKIPVEVQSISYTPDKGSVIMPMRNGEKLGEHRFNINYLIDATKSVKTETVFMGFDKEATWKAPLHIYGEDLSKVKPEVAPPEEVKPTPPKEKPVEKPTAEEAGFIHIPTAEEWRIATSRILGVIDIETPYRAIGAPKTGIAVKNYFSKRVAHQEMGINLIKKLNRMGYSKEDFTQLAFLAERPTLFVKLPGAERKRFSPGYQLVRKDFAKYFDLLKREGGLSVPFPESLIRRLVERNAHLRINLEKGRTNFFGKNYGEAWRTEVARNERVIESLKKGRVKFVHIPTRLWFDSLMQTNPNRTFRILSLLSARKRVAPTIYSLVKAGLIKPEEVDIRDIIGNYHYRVGRDLGLLNIFSNAKAEGLVKPLALALEEWSSLPSRRFPMFKGYKVHPVFADYLQNFLATVRRGYGINRFLAYTKMMQFYNPLFLPMYDVVQATMLGSIPNIKMPIYMAKAISQSIKKPEAYWEAFENGLFSQPFLNPFEDFKQILEGLKKKSTHAGAVAKTFSAMEKLLPQKAIKTFYNLVWHTAWNLDRTVRLISYNYLLDHGFPSLEAAQVSAKFHGDYASVPPRTRKFINKVFFTPTFKIVMAKLYWSMLKGAVRIFKAGRTERIFARGLLYTLAIILGKHYMMTKWGYEADQFSRRYSKVVETDEGPKELVHTFSNPANLPLKYYHRAKALFDPATTNRIKRVVMASKWEFHPVYRVALDIVTNQKADFDYVYDPFAKGGVPEQAVQIARYATGELVRVSSGLIEERKGEELVKAYKAMQKDLGKFKALIMRPFVFTYLRKVKDVRVAGQLFRLEKELRTFIYRRLDDPEAIERAVKDFKKRIEKIQKGLE